MKQKSYLVVHNETREPCTEIEVHRSPRFTCTSIENADQSKESDQTTDLVPKEQPVVRRTFKTRMSPLRLFNLIKDLNSKQRQAIEEIGFGGFLCLSLSKLPTKLCDWLIDNFDENSCYVKLSRGQLKITEEDVHLTLGSPLGRKCVIEGGSKNVDMDEYKDLLKSWRHEWEVKDGCLSTNGMVRKIVDQRDGGDKFKRNFVVFVVSSCLKGNANENVNQRILRSLVDLKSIQEFNWCLYTLQKLCEAVIDWKEKSIGFFTGSILILMMCCLDRVVFWTIIVDSVFPTIKGWSDKITKTRKKRT